MDTFQGQTPHLVGRELLDLNNEKIGTVTDFCCDNVTTEPKWVVVKMGMLGKKAVVPAGAIRARGDKLAVIYTKDRVKHAPGPSADGAVAEAVEEQLHRYYDTL